MAEDASDVKITKSDIEKLLTAKDDASLARFEKCEANWTNSEHWKQFWCPRIDGTEFVNWKKLMLKFVVHYVVYYSITIGVPCYVCTY